MAFNQAGSTLHSRLEMLRVLQCISQNSDQKTQTTARAWLAQAQYHLEKYFLR